MLLKKLLVVLTTLAESALTMMICHKKSGVACLVSLYPQGILAMEARLPLRHPRAFLGELICAIAVES